MVNQVDRLRACPAPFPWACVISIAQQIGAALAYVHSQRVVHCDLKPGNILFDGRGHALLSDFGTAALAAEPAAGGTPGYAAPEQVIGRSVDQRTDVYSFAAVIVAMLAGGDDLLQSGDGSLRMPGGIPLRVEETLSRAMSAEPSLRFSSVVELLARLATG